MGSSNGRLFHEVREHEVTRAIIRGFAEQMEQYAQCDVLIAGGGPSGLMCGLRLAGEGVRTMVVERNNYLGGGFWVGGYLMNTVTVRAPSQRILDELGVPYRQVSEGLFAVGGPHVCSKLIASACDAGVAFLNLTSVDDVVLRDGRVEGLVVNWSAVHSLPRQITCVDPVALEAKVVVDATGHDAVVAAFLARRGLLDVPGCGAMWVDQSEDAVVERTGEVYAGLVATGMAVSSLYGLPRMGPTFGGMLLSGEKAAAKVLEILKDQPIPVGASG